MQPNCQIVDVEGSSLCVHHTSIPSRKDLLSRAAVVTVLWAVTCPLKVFPELGEHPAREAANLESKFNVLLPSNCYKCDKLSY